MNHDGNARSSTIRRDLILASGQLLYVRGPHPLRFGIIHHRNLRWAADSEHKKAALPAGQGGEGKGPRS